MRTEDAVKALVLVARAREDSRGMTEESFKSQPFVSEGGLGEVDAINVRESN